MDAQALQNEAKSAISGAKTLDELDAARVRYLGRKSELKQALREVRDPETGRVLNTLREQLERAIEEREAALRGADLEQRLAEEPVDVTLPARATQRGHLHLITQIRREVEDVFLGLGYTIVDGDEVEDTWHLFDALNMPPGHVTRSPLHTLFLNGDIVLRTETSPSQIRVMEAQDPPVFIVSLGRTYRRDTVDATHSPLFHQVEGLAVDKDITLADLKGTLLHLAKALFGEDRRVRFMTDFFPFTEPSLGTAVSCFLCDGAGCSVCKQTGWIEMGGSGLVDPNVLRNLGLYRVGRVLQAGKHPNADRLQLCTVDVGDDEPRQIVCGAWNFGAGATVAVALPGAILPDGQRLEQAKLRGTVSDGMILSERELELGAEHGGILVLDDGPDPGTPLADVLPLSDDVLELETGHNRPDLLSVYGIAREVAALLGTELGPPPGVDPPRAGDEPVDVQIEDYDGCPRYIGRTFREVRMASSPPWLKARLLAAGMRPISNVVDITNYVMLGLGNPLHAFDQSKLGERRIVVRRARKGEQMRTLDDTLRALDERDLVIADAEHAVAIAGIMGSLESEVDEQTTDVLLEAANFEPLAIHRSSERLRLRTEGSNRWEKGVDPYLAEQAAKLATELLVELTGARWTGDLDVRGDLPARPVVHLRPERTDLLVGLRTEPEEQRAILERIGFDVGPDWSVTVPTWRARDVTREADLVEEVARFRLDEVPFTLPQRTAMFGRLTKDQRLRRVVEEVLAGCGFSESYNWSLVPEDDDPQALRLPEPLSVDQTALRTTLRRGLIDSAQRNADAGAEDVALFEIARVYLPAGEKLPDERWRVGAIASGGFARAKGAVETLHEALKIELRVEPGPQPFLHPGKAARVESGWVGELHPALLAGSWGIFELDLASLFASVPDVIHYEDVITYPPVRQDLAFVVNEDVQAADLIAAAREAAGPELREMRPFDVYRGDQIGPGKKSIAFAVSFQSSEGTLTDEDAAELRNRIVAGLEAGFGARLRA